MCFTYASHNLKRTSLWEKSKKWNSFVHGNRNGALNREQTKDGEVNITSPFLNPQSWKTITTVHAFNTEKLNKPVTTTRSTRSIFAKLESDFILFSPISKAENPVTHISWTRTLERKPVLKLVYLFSWKQTVFICSLSQG